MKFLIPLSHIVVVVVHFILMQKMTKKWIKMRFLAKKAQKVIKIALKTKNSSTFDSKKSQHFVLSFGVLVCNSGLFAMLINTLLFETVAAS